MKFTAVLVAGAQRFDALSMRERAFICAAALGVILVIWNSALMAPLAAKRSRLSLELRELQSSIQATAETLDPPAAAEQVRAALAQQETLQARLDSLDAQLASTAAGLIAPDRMVSVIRDVLEHQHGLKLITLHNKPMRSLAPPPAARPGVNAVETGPYVHPVELVVEGSYFDVLAYLHALEGLPWRFYWSALELDATHYPVNRVRVELSTVNMDKAWLGV